MAPSFLTSERMMLPSQLHFSLVCFVLTLMLSACEKSDSKPQSAVQQKPAPVVPAPKLSNDATTYAQHAYRLINALDGLVVPQNAKHLERTVRRPVRELSIDWRVNVKMTDSVTEGKYALCRKALTSLDIWARETAEQLKVVPDKQANYLRDKQLCENALSHPALGNTDPKQVGIQ